jgi:TolB-like protein
VLLQFENYALDTDRRELRREGALVAVEPQVFDLIEYLVRHRDRVVSKDDLIDGVWGGRIVSDSTLSSRLTAVRQALQDNGDAQRLIRTIPPKGFRFVGTVLQSQEMRDQSNAAQSAEQGDLARLKVDVISPFSDKPSIAILPFANLSGDPAQEYFADGMVEEIITAMSRFRQLLVMARNCSSAFKDRVVDAKQIGRELGVRYLLEGSVRKASNAIRITAQLVDARTGTYLWADRFDGAQQEIFRLQDKVTANVVGAIFPKLERAEIERAKHKPTENLDAYDYYLRGMDKLYQWTIDGISEALRLFRRAIEKDPEFASAYGMAAYCYVQRKSYGWFTDRRHEFLESEHLARRAAELGKDDAFALTRAAHALFYVVGDVKSGAAFIDQALMLNPNLAAAWYVSGWIRIMLGEPEITLEHLMRAGQLSPFDPLIFRIHAAIGYAKFFAGLYDDAAEWSEKAVRVAPDYLTGIRGAAASLALNGQLDEAHKLMAHMRKLDSALRLSNLRDLFPLRRPEDLARYAEGLKKAGLPE